MKKTKKQENTLIIGGQGSGMTYHYVKPNITDRNNDYIITDRNNDYIITDPNNEFYRDTQNKSLTENGYKIKELKITL